MTHSIPTRCCALLVFAVSCEAYEAEPLDFDTQLAAVLEAAVEPAARFDLDRAANELLTRNPAVVAKRVAVRAAYARQGIGPLLANPQISAGPLIFDGLGIAGDLRRGVESALGWAFPLGARLAATRDLYEAQAEAAQAQWAAEVRRQYLRLRRSAAQLCFARERVELAGQVRELATRAVAFQRELALSGGAQPLDVRLAELARQRAETAWYQANAAWLDVRSQIAMLCGIQLAEVGAVLRRDLPQVTDPPSEEALRRALAGHPDLTDRQATYEVAERSLRLEVEKQYPNLSLLPSYEREQKVDRWGLSLGIQLPIFDRNQQGIAKARYARTAARKQYETRLRGLLVGVSRARALLAAQRARLEAAQRAKSLAGDLRELRRQSHESGTLDAIRLLAIYREETRARQGALAAEAAYYDAWTQLEGAVGVPLLRFPTSADKDAGGERAPEERR